MGLIPLGKFPTLALKDAERGGWELIDIRKVVWENTTARRLSHGVD